ncbi:MAG: sigma-70 family RNA polymerase sigma factor, partial [Bryobacterales bacterium]|nr:sigma-70 family RNA polymerase sigma factor [Bryobacterales bacterium]
MHEDEAAFRRIYERTAPRLRAYLHLAVRDPALADDVLQEAYYRLLGADLEDAAIGQVRSYLYKTARTLVADHGRRVGRERKHQQRWNTPVSESPRHDLTLDMERLFARLSEREQTLLWLAYVEGASHREIAASLGIGENSVRVVLYRARKRLAGILEGHG